MDIKNERAGVLTNNEVLNLLQAVLKEESAKNQHLKVKGLAIVAKSAIKYLKSTPAASQNTENICETIRKVKPYKLTAAETLQIINLRPTTATEVQLIVEESEERFKTEEKINSLIDIITGTLPPK